MPTIQDYETLREAFDYCPETGQFFWKIWSGRATPGEVAGCYDNGYIRLRYKKVFFLAHRAAFFMAHGHLPKEVDHINGNKSDNRACNLRAATSAQNRCNVSLTANNKSGVKGVSWEKRRKKWSVTLYKHRKRVFRAEVSDFFEACCLIHSARNKHHGEYANHG